jgi:hypothetical protein
MQSKYSTVIHKLVISRELGACILLKILPNPLLPKTIRNYLAK